MSRPGFRRSGVDSTETPVSVKYSRLPNPLTFAWSKTFQVWIATLTCGGGFAQTLLQRKGHRPGRDTLLP